jgi:4-hydroxyphenylpyruvate dioxygenase
MYFHHLHFYVRDVAFWREWFIDKLAFTPAPSHFWAHQRLPMVDRLTQAHELASSNSPCFSSASQGAEVLVQGAIEIRLSSEGAAAGYLSKHPPGLADVGFATDCFDRVLRRSRIHGATLTQPISVNAAGQRQCQLQGWADLRHTLVEVSPQWVAAHLAAASATRLCTVDHVVLNVPQGDLDVAAAWYQRVFGLVSTQQFDITTARSGLRSQVLVHPEGTLQMPLNEPTSANSQIQDFLDHNRGPGVQHVALRSCDAVEAIAHFRQQGLDLLSVPKTYYDSLQKRPDCPLADTSAASRQQLLLDWVTGGQQGMLLQTFTQPIFTEPTFFFEVIERGTYVESGQTKCAQGFGEGNFQALFEAIERAQVERDLMKGQIKQS